MMDRDVVARRRHADHTRGALGIADRVCTISDLIDAFDCVP
jgi:hypothetical protein